VGSLGDGNTDFNPGGTNPDGDNSTVPRGNATDGTSPSVYPLLERRPDLAATIDQQAADALNAVIGKTRRFLDMNATEQEKALNAAQILFAEGEMDWNEFAQNPGFREAYVARYGDPLQSTYGNTQNTRNADGSAQGQYEPESGGTFQAIADNAAENDRDITLEELSSERLNDILSQDSPLMTLARQDGVRVANRLGLRNSSLAAGAQMAEMARQASPLAMQEAEATNRSELQNQALESERRANNAALETEVSVSNAGMANDMLNSDRQRKYGMELQQLAGDQDFAKQELAASTAIDVANIEGQYKQIISENDTAARMFQSYYDVVQSVLGNSEYTEGEASGRLRKAKDEFEAGMEMILGFEVFDLDNTNSGNGANAAEWDSLPPEIQSMWEAAGYDRGNFPGLGGSTIGGGGFTGGSLIQW